MPKATLLDSILGRPSQTYAGSGAYGGDMVASSRAPSEVGSASQAGSALRSPSTRGYGASRSNTSRARRSRHPSMSDAHTLVPDTNMVNPFSRWWEERSQADSSAGARGRELAEPATHARVPPAQDSSDWQAWLRSFEQRRETPRGSVSPPSQLYVPLTQDESGLDMSEMGYALTQDVHDPSPLRSVHEEDESFGTMRFSSTPPVTSASRLPTLALPAETVGRTSPAFSAPKPSVRRPLRTLREPARSTQPGDAFEALPDEELARLSWDAMYLADGGLVQTSPTKPTHAEPTVPASPPQPSPERAPSVQERAPSAQERAPPPPRAEPELRAPTTRATRPVLEPSPVFREPAHDLGASRRRRVEGLLRPLQDHRLSTLSVSESVREELSPDVAPWTAHASVLGHLERSELHGTAEDLPPTPTESSAMPLPVTPSAAPPAATTPNHATTRRMLDRPRHRGPRPTALGGIQIAHGTLPAPTPGHTPRRSVSDQAALRSAPPVPSMPPLRHVSDTRVARDAQSWTDEDPPEDTLPAESGGAKEAPRVGDDVYTPPPAAERDRREPAPALRTDGAWSFAAPAAELRAALDTASPRPALSISPSKAIPTSPIPGLAPPLTTQGSLTASPYAPPAAPVQREEPVHTYQVYDADSIAPTHDVPAPPMPTEPTLPYLAVTPARPAAPVAWSPGAAPAVSAPLSPVRAPESGAAMSPWSRSPERYGSSPSAPLSPYAMRQPAPPTQPTTRPVHQPAPAPVYPARGQASMASPSAPSHTAPSHGPTRMAPPLGPSQMASPSGPSHPSPSYGPTRMAPPPGPSHPAPPSAPSYMASPSSPSPLAPSYGPMRMAPTGPAQMAPPSGPSHMASSYGPTRVAPTGPSQMAPPSAPSHMAPPSAPSHMAPSYGPTRMAPTGPAHMDHPSGPAHMPSSYGPARMAASPGPGPMRQLNVTPAYAGPVSPAYAGPVSPTYAGPMSPGYAGPASPSYAGPVSPGAWVRPGAVPMPGWGPGAVVPSRVHMVNPVRIAPPRAELMAPSERDPAQVMSMRRVSSTPDVSRFRYGAMSDTASLMPSRDARAFLSPDMARRARTGADSDANSMTTNMRANTPMGRTEPSLADSTSVLGMSTAAAMKKAPLGASTNQYLGLSSDASGPAVGDSGSTRSPPSSSGRGGGLHGRLRPADDLVRARPTMAAVQVTGVGSASAGMGGRLQRRVSTNQLSRQRSDVNAPSMEPQGPTGSISLVPNMASPRKVGSTQVIVQVIAVAIDRVDRALVAEKLHSESGSVLVPGRSFCGRIVEMGWDVKKLRMGDMVFGLQDLKKGGALAEFLCVDQDLVASAPEGRLSAEQICALPATGIMVHQIIQEHCVTLPRGARVLILQAHDNMGLLAMQEASRLGLVIVAQVPTQAADAVSICRANGASEVVTGEPLWSINLLHESSFQLVIDTIGGRAIYDACRRVLANHGQFVTCYGDGNGLPNPTHRSHLRSLRRSFFRKDRKVLGYEWVGIDASADHRAALESIKTAAQRGAISPRIQSVLPLEDAFRAFSSDDDGVVVVRVT